MHTPKQAPERMCVGCRKVRPKRELLRIVKSPAGIITVDTTGKAQGRGAYVCPEVTCLEKVAKGHLLEKTFKCSLSPEVYANLKGVLATATAKRSEAEN